MSPCDVSGIVEQMEYGSRLEFLYKAVEDTQSTIRFLDTKAAFCVTLLSGMAAVTLQGHRVPHSTLEKALLAAFIACVAATLLFCMRVIFPVMKPHSDHSLHTTRTIPKFFVGHHKSHHWLRHTLTSEAKGVLCEDRASYTAAVSGANDEDLLIAMCDELLLVSLVRQIKADRLQTVKYALAVGVGLFAGILLM